MFKRVLLFALATTCASASVAQPVSQPAPSSSQPSVSVPRDVLERYVGRYELNGTVATVGLTGDNRLTVQLTGQPAGSPLRTVSANEFAADAVGVHLFFEGDGPKATRLRSRYAGEDVIGTRITAASALGSQDRRDIMAKLSEALRQRYVFPDVGERTAAKIEAALAAGDYDGLTDPEAFAMRLTDDANAIAHDKHLRILAMLPQPPAASTRTPSAESGIARADRLAGGVGYIELIGFPPPAVFKQPLDRAMSSLAGSKALIIDVRRNGGGSPEAVAYLSSFLVTPDVHLNDIISRVANTNDFTRTSFRSVPTPVSFAGVPVYILTSRNTFSGGEEFAYEVQAQKRGTVIGEVTGGGANPGGIVALTHGFNVGLPFGRAENPVTKTNWEGRGVQPDVQVPAESALAVALERAGQKPISEIGAASVAQVFAPRAATIAPANGPPVEERLVPYANAEDSVALPDGRKLHIVCMGKGSPTVILTAGAGDFAGRGWGMIQPEMAKITRTCSWDRAGFGLTDGTTADVTVALTTADLEAAVANGKIAGHYVMVGHSLGSYESLLFTDRHPDKVVGMVLVDPSFPDQFARMLGGRPAPDPGQDPLVQTFRKCAADIRAGTTKADGPDPNGCFAYPPTWPTALRQALAKKVSNPVQYEAMASFSVNILVDSKQVINPLRNYHDMPLIVLTAGDQAAPPPGSPPLTDEQKAQMAARDTLWNQGHDELAALSTRGVNTRVPGANHYIQLTKPQAVLDAVAEVVREARASER